MTKIVFMGKKVGMFFLIGVFLISIFPEAVADLGQSSNSQMALKPCTTMSELDCIETFSLSYPNGKSVEIKLVQPVNGDFLDEYNQKIENSGSVWTYLDSKGTTRKIVITTTLNGENYKSPVYKRLYSAMWFSILELDKSEIASGVKFKLTLRTSWLKPQGVGLMAANAGFSSEEMKTGTRFTFMGSPFLSTTLNSPSKYLELGKSSQDNTQSDGEIVNLYFVIDHFSSILGGSFWDASCSHLGYFVTSHNAIGAGQPFMSDVETLKFNIGAPHRLSSGEITKGFFTVDVPIAYINCRWPQNTLTKAPRVEISVTNSDGTVQTAVTSVKSEKGILKVRAFGFHYSQPTIVLRASNDLTLPNPASVPISENAPTPTIKKIFAKKTIVCSKGKLTKRVTSPNPKCPLGYKIKA